MMNRYIKADTVGVVIVSYNPDATNLIVLCNKISCQADYVVVVDNGSLNLDHKIKADIQNIENVEFIGLSENVGIATAQNEGIKRLMNIGVDYCMFFDQDSIPPINIVRSLRDSYELYAGKIKIAAIGPNFFDPRYGFFYPQIKLNRFGIRKRLVPKPSSELLELSFIISSGTFTSMKVIEDIGLMKDEYFIDYVDTEWCLRAQSLGYKNYILPSCIMEHTIGDNNLKFLCFKLPVHSPLRRYYRMRNMFYMFKLPYVPLVMKLRELITNSAHQFLITISSNKKKEYFYYWSRALVDGVRILMTKD